jgi:hypothetical protein
MTTSRLSNICSLGSGGMKRPITRSDIVVMRRSLGMSPHLPAEQTTWLLDEADRLLGERARIDAVVARLASPWADVRVVLNELHRLLGVGGRPGEPGGA